MLENYSNKLNENSFNNILKYCLYTDFESDIK